MILLAYRHGLRASELCSLRWDMLDLAQGRYHVTRRKNGRPSVHLIRGNEIRDLRRLQREQVPQSIYVFTTERRGPMTPATFRKHLALIGAAAGLPFPVHPHMLRHAVEIPVGGQELAVAGAGGLVTLRPPCPRRQWSAALVSGTAG